MCWRSYFWNHVFRTNISWSIFIVIIYKKSKYDSRTRAVEVQKWSKFDLPFYMFFFLKNMISKCFFVPSYCSNYDTVPTTRLLRFILQKTVTIWRIFEFNSVFSWQFSKISQKIAKRNHLVCNDLVVGTVNQNLFKSYSYHIFKIMCLRSSFSFKSCF